MDPIKLGLLGCGLAARHLHWPAIRQLSADFVVSALSNRRAQKAEALAELIVESGAERPAIYGDFRDLAMKADVDALVVLLPLDLNEEAVRTAAGAGKHLLLEKPLSTDLESGRRILEIEKAEPKLVFMLAENYRYRRVYLELARLLKEGVIGRPVFAEWKAWQYVDPASNIWAQTQWRTQHSFEGGFVTDAGVHNIAALRDLFGEMERIGSTVDQLNPAIGRTDSLAFLFRSSGRDGIPPITGLFHSCFSTKASRNELEVMGTKGSLKVQDSKIILENREMDYPDDGGYRAEYEAFRDMLRENKAVRPGNSLEEGYRDLEAILSAVSP